MDRCVVCQRSSGTLVEKPFLIHIKNMLACARKRSELGESKYKKLSDTLSALDEDDLKKLRYHSVCRKLVINKQHIKRVENRAKLSTGNSKPQAMKGRPKKRACNSSLTNRPKRMKTLPKCKACVFQPERCVVDEDGFEELYRVATENRGKTLIKIKEETHDDLVRSKLSNLFDPGDAAAQEIWYHQSCFRSAERTCKPIESDNGGQDDNLVRAIADAQICSYVRNELISGNTSLTMNDVNDKYEVILKQNKINDNWHHKKHVKDLIIKRIPEAQFIKPVSKMSEMIIASRDVGDAVETYHDPTSTVASTLKVASVMRQELLQSRNWKFSGAESLNEYQNPPLTLMFLEALLCGPHFLQLEGQRKDDAQSAVNTVCQMLVQNTLTTRQIKHKANQGFKRVSETPLSVLLPLSTHQKTRSKELTKLLSEVYVANAYSSTLQLEKRVHQAIMSRLEDTEHRVCIPDFVKKDIPVFFAVDNIDFLEDTPCGKNTLHGTLIVMFQKDNKNDERNSTINTPLRIPDTLVSNPLQLKVKYKQAPNIHLDPIKFEHTQYRCESKPDLDYNKIWALSSYASNKVEVKGESYTSYEMAGPHEDILTPTPSCTKNHCLSKVDVMPTWAATCSLILQSSGKQVERVNSEVVTPLFKSPPTDMTTLYTALSLTQEISSLVVGPPRQTIITLDMDLYERAVKLQQSGGYPWILRPGELHVCMAALHALGKNLEGSGLDTLAIENGLYSAAAIRGIYSGKAFKRGVEYHLVTYMACMMLRLDAIADNLDPNLLEKCNRLKKSLHDRSPKVQMVYEDISAAFAGNVKDTLEKYPEGELALWMHNYMQQVEVLLRIIKGCREGIHEEYLVALDDQVKYFFQFDLYKYARMIPVYLAQMQQLKEKNEQGWQTLQDGNFCVRKSNVQFTALFSDQALEQWIKDLKSVVVGLTQSNDGLDRAISTAPYLSKILKDWMNTLPNHSSVPKHEHHHLVGTTPIRQANHAKKLKDAIFKHCGGNPFTKDIPLRNISSSVLIPEPAKTEILTGPQKGANLYEQFKKDRLSKEAKGSVWERMTKAKIKTFNTWMPKKTLKIADKVIKLREERNLLSRLLIIQGSRPQLSLGETIGHYELSVIPRSLFDTDGSLLIPRDKSEIMAELQTRMKEYTSDETVVAIPLKKVVIIDAMAEVQALKIEPNMKVFGDLTNAFVARIERKIEHYQEGRIVFDRYDVSNSLKCKTRLKRTKQIPIEYDIHKDMAISHVSMKDILSSTKNKLSLTHQFGEAILQKYNNSEKKVVVVKGTEAKVNKDFQLSEDIKEHDHEEADTLIPLHVIDCLRDTTLKEVTVFSPDTDVLVLLIDLVANERAGAFTVIKFVNRTTKLNVTEIVKAIGKEKCQGLNGVHNFSGADWGGKFAGIGKKRWIQTYLGLPSNDPAIKFFTNLGTCTIGKELAAGNLHDELKPAEKFLCSLYVKGASEIPDTRWELFKSKNKEGEQLPPTRAALLPHIQRVNYICARDKSYVSAKQQLQSRENLGWDKIDGLFKPTTSLNPPAPQAVLELVKCGCRKSCTRNSCSCRKSSLVCTPLCKCIDCENCIDYSVLDEADDNDIEDTEETA